MTNPRSIPHAEVVPAPGDQATPPLCDLALAAVATVLPGAADGTPADRDAAARLERLHARLAARDGALAPVLDACLRRPAPADVPLVAAAGELALMPAELLAVALAAAVEHDPLAGRLVAYAQGPGGRTRPTLGLVARAFTAAFGYPGALVPTLLAGEALRTGLLVLDGSADSAPERTLRVPEATALALRGHDGTWPEVTVGLPADGRVALPPSAAGAAARHAAALRAAPGRHLVVRAGSRAERESAAGAVVEALGRRPAFVHEAAAGLGPWLRLRRLTPVFLVDPAPGACVRLPPLPGYGGPVLACCGPDGAVEPADGAAATWRLAVPGPAERTALWRAALGDAALAERLGTHHRHGAGRIAHLARAARHQAALDDRAAPGADDLAAAAWSVEGGGLDALAVSLRDPVPDAAFVAPPALRARLDALLDRCRLRDALPDGLGASTTTRYHSGLRVLFTGPSGTGKTLAAGWLATRLGVPLFRVDLASVTSKYIGETEKNLAQLLARAEQADVVLLFDEADALFGRRTEVHDANDRFANAQTNYLLQRIEHYEGIVLLTSNSQARFDAAFTRRLDVVIDFPAPGPAERRALWAAHLGDAHALSPEALNRLALHADLNGGQVRNAVLAAAAAAGRRPIGLDHVRLGVEAECAKLGRPVPFELGAAPDDEGRAEA